MDFYPSHFLVFTTHHIKSFVPGYACLLQAVYCGTTGFEVSHVDSVEEKEWLLKEIEQSTPVLSKPEQLTLLDWLVAATRFEHFLKVKYGTEKRFGLDGSETMIPGVSLTV